jgi:ABC-type nitrate/sulfonate/bicarbonate transport system ATPase subunit
MSGVYEQSSGNFWSEGLGYRLFRSQEDGQDGLMIAMLLTFALTGGAGEILLTCIWKSVKWIGRFLRRRQIRGAINALKRRVRTADVAWPKPGSLCVEDLSADYGGSLAFSKCSFSVAAGETLPILGESGSGKTTLLRAVAHLFGDGLHVEGRVLVDGELAVQDQRIGIVFQDALVFPMLTVWENAIYGKHARANPAYAYQLLVDFGISDLVTQGSDALSGGQRQRLALACALANAPRILLLDEPFGALDAITRYRLQEFFVTQIRGRTTCLFVTHDINEAIEVASEEIMVGLGERAKLLKVQQPEANSPRLMDHEYRSLHGTLKDALRSVHNGPSGFAVHR